MHIINELLPLLLQLEQLNVFLSIK